MLMKLVLFLNFSRFSLPGVKEQIAQMLSMIGRVDGLFSTYTAHDISHVDSMLGMIEWLIPSSTAAVLTPTDWLMMVLSVYFHDLGLVVTADEYRTRSSNSDFVSWYNNLGKK